MLFDGDCYFCRRWIEHWKEITDGRVDYIASQEGLASFPEIPADECARAVQLIETDGVVYRGAAAVFRSLGYGRGRGWLARAYERIPGFSAVTEAGYAFIARNRAFASSVSRVLWGKDVRRPTYFAARRGFLKTLGLAYLFAFLSIWVQVDGLMGAHGIFPGTEMMGRVRESLGAHPMTAPTICWWSASDLTLHALCLVGTLAAVLLTLGLLPLPALIACFVCYLSLITPGELFFSYQWDMLLLEAGFVAFLLAPGQWRLGRGRDAPVSGLGLFLAKALLFKLMFMSGVVKLTSGDPSWLNLTALDYHYWTQPLPTVFAWFADKHPEWLKKACVAFALFVEVVVPFFIWAPRRLRIAAAWLLIALQLAIAITGNYCFFNLLTIALCLLLFDDFSWRPKLPRETAGSPFRGVTPVAIAAVLITLPVNLWWCYTAIAPEAKWPGPLLVLRAYCEPFRIANGYGLFRVMTKERPEIVFEGSADAFDWHPYEFKWKPGDVNRAPQWNAPHQPRLDWSMWFAALGSQRDQIVAVRFAGCLLRNEASVLRLLAANPFPNAPPRYIRASVYEYRFTTAEEKTRTGAWWKRRLRRQYLPVVSLQDLER